METNYNIASMPTKERVAILILCFYILIVAKTWKEELWIESVLKKLVAKCWVSTEKILKVCIDTDSAWDTGHWHFGMHRKFACICDESAADGLFSLSCSNCLYPQSHSNKVLKDPFLNHPVSWFSVSQPLNIVRSINRLGVLLGTRFRQINQFLLWVNCIPHVETLILVHILLNNLLESSRYIWRSVAQTQDKDDSGTWVVQGNVTRIHC